MKESLLWVMLAGCLIAAPAMNVQSADGDGQAVEKRGQQLEKRGNVTKKKEEIIEKKGKRLEEKGEKNRGWGSDLKMTGAS